MKTQITKHGVEDGKTSYIITAERLNKPVFAGIIRWFGPPTLTRTGNKGKPHWAVLHWNGGSEMFATLKEAKAAARSKYDRGGYLLDGGGFWA